MLIYVTVSKRFHHPSVSIENFELEVDPNYDVGKLKVQITSQFTDIGTKDFDLLCVANNTILSNQLLVHQIEKIENQIHVRITNLGEVEPPGSGKSRTCQLI